MTPQVFAYSHAGGLPPPKDGKFAKRFCEHSVGPGDLTT